jgi:pimeloyl-ACP methyl ester carboxylesterase
VIAALPRVRLGYDDDGSGLPVIFLHGFPHDRGLWTQQHVALSSRVRCVTPDLRGFGESSTDGPYSMTQYADDVVSLMDWLEIEDALVCGLSMGGYIAMAMWRQHPSRIRALALCDTRAGADTDASRTARNDSIGLVRREGPSAIAEKMLTGMLGASTRSTRPETVAFMRDMMARQPVAGIVGALESLRDRPDSRPTLRTITVPTLVLVGEEDALTPESDARELIGLLPVSTRARLECIPRAGHVTCVERPAAVTHALAEFVAELVADHD